MATYKSNFIEELKSKINIVDVIGRFIHLQKKGRDYWACCPFHHENTPSFQVREDHQYFKCFGCQKSGNAVTFVMEHERMTYPEAIEYLAGQAGLKIPEEFEFTQHTQKKELAEKLYAVNAAAAMFYHNSLYTPEGKAAKDYFERRGLDDAAVKRFGLGFSPSVSALPEYMEKIGYSTETLKTAGLIYINKFGKPCDTFYGRAMVPIISPNGKVLGFGGRVLEKTDFAKYKNTSSTPVFDKSSVLYGLNLYKKLTQTERVSSMVLVEGYMDVISLYQAGIKNAVAPMGTSLTQAQCRIIKRYTENVYVCFDGDGAGQSAAWRSLDMLKESKLDVKVISLSDGMDPDDYVRKYGKEGFVSLMQKALPLFDYKLKVFEDKYQLNTADNRRKYAEEAVIELKKLDTIEKEVYAKIVAAKSGISIETVLSLADGAEIMQAEEPKPYAPQKQTSKDKSEERFVVSALCNGERYADISKLDSAMFENSLHKMLFERLKEASDGGAVFRISDLFDPENPNSDSDAGITAVMDAAEAVDAGQRPAFYAKCVNRLINEKNARKYRELAAMLPSLTDQREIDEIKADILALSKAQPKK